MSDDQPDTPDALAQALSEGGDGAPPEIAVDADIALVPFHRPAVLPTVAEFEFIFTMAERLCRSQMVPNSCAGKPADVAIILLAARDLGIPITQAFAKLNVINGKLSLAAEVVVALVIRDGHRIWCDDWTDTHVTAAGQRRGSDYVARYTYTLADAVQAGLCTLTEDGRAFARDDKGRAMPWEKFTKNMMWARAATGLGRMNFPDTTAGISYAPEELSDEERFMAHPASAVDVEVREAFAARIAALDDDHKASLRLAWGTYGLNPLSKLTVEEVGAVEELIAKAEAIDVPSSPPDTPAPAPAAADDPAAQETTGGAAAQETSTQSGSEDGDRGVVDTNDPTVSTDLPHPDSVQHESDVEGRAVFNGDTGYCSACGSPIWFSAQDSTGDGGWMHADDADDLVCPVGDGVSSTLVPAEEGVEVDQLYLASHQPKVDVDAISAEVGALSQTKVLQRLGELGLPLNGRPKDLKARLVNHLVGRR